MKKLIVLISFVFALSAASYGQTVECPAGFVCISQAAANQAAENSRELAATKNKVAVLEQVLAEKDKSIAELKAANEQNVADLKRALHNTEIQLADKTGQLIKTEAQVVQQSAIIDFMLKNGRTKKFGILVF